MVNSPSNPRTPPLASPAGLSRSSSPQTNNHLPNGQSVYQPGVTPIKFHDEEVRRMHAELAKQQSLQPKARPSCPVRQQKRMTLTGFFLRVAFFYLALAYVVVCPQDANRERAVCRSLDSFQTRALEYRPYVQPYVDQAKAKLEPYWDHYTLRAEPYLKQVRPHARRAQAWARPRVLRGIQYYKSRVHPRALKGIVNIRAHSRPLIARGVKLYNTTLAPSVEWYTHEAKGWYAKTAQPHVTRLQGQATAHGQTAYNYLAPVYYQGVPKATRFYHGTLAPTAAKTYRQGEKTYLKQVHPRLVVGYGHSASFVKAKVLPSAYRFYSLYIAPQLDKIKERIFEYRAKHSEAVAAQRVIDLENKKLRDAELDDFADFIDELREEHAWTAEPVAAATQTFTPPPPHASGEEPSPEEVAAERAAKRTTLETLSTTYEKEIVRLGHVEHDLLQKRLIEIREEALADIPKRFGAAVTSLDDEGDKYAGRLSKYFAKVLEDDKTPIESKVADSEFLAKKASIKVKHLADQILAEVAEYRKSLDDKERNAVAQASSALTALVGKAQEEIGYGWTWFDGTTYKDWQRYHGLAKAQSAWIEQYEQLRSGELEDSILPSLDPNAALVEVESSVQQLTQAFETILSQIKIKGQHDIKGEWNGVADGAQKVAAAAGDKLAAAAEAIRASASSIVGVTAEATPTDLVGSASSLASVAKESAASLVSEATEALPTVPAVPAIPTDYIVEPVVAAASSASNAVESVYAEASQAAYRAVGKEPSPTDLQQSATSLVNAASSAAASAAASVSASAVSLAQRAVGGEVAPTDLAGSASSVASAASSAAAEAQASVISAAQRVVSGTPVPAASAASQKVASAYADVSKAALRAVGQEPAPTDLAGSASSAVSVASSMAAAASSSVRMAVSQAVSGEPVPLASVASSKAVRAAGDASQAVLRAVGQEPSPTDGHQSATSIRNAASSAVVAASASVVSAVGEAQSVLAGVPEAASSAVVAAPESVRSAYSAAASAVDSVVEEQAASAVSLVGEGYSEASRVAASVVEQATSLIAPAPVRAQLSAAAEAVGSQFEQATEAAAAAASSASVVVGSVAGQASQEAIRAVGGEPSPTDVRQVVTSAGKKLRRKVPASKASGAASQVSSQASSVVSQASKAAESAAEAVKSVAGGVAEAVRVPHVEL